MSNEFEELLDDVTEYAKYCEEIGFDGMPVDLPAVSQSAAPRRLPAIAQKTAPEAIDKYVPDELPSVQRPQETERSARPSRLGLLEQSRLSNLNTTGMPAKKNPTESANKSAKPSASEESFVNVVENPSASLPASKEVLADVRKDIGDCKRCGLCEERTQVVHSTGNLKANLMFVGEAPGADEDQKGEPFVGRAGQLLTKIIEAIGFNRDEVFIGNINRCRPPGNRAPTLPEADACKPFLLREIAIVKPKVIVVLGNTACQNLLNTKIGITKLRGNFQDYYGVKVMPTFHPAYLLRDPHKKREVWEDMKKVRDYLNSL